MIHVYDIYIMQGIWWYKIHYPDVSLVSLLIDFNQDSIDK